MKKNERLQALQILCDLIGNQVPLSHALTEPSLSAFSKQICFGVSRHYEQLQVLANKLVKKRPKQIEVWVSLLMGLYELHFLRTPDYAVVKETVALLDTIKRPWAKGLINAVLRTYCRQKDSLIPELSKVEAFQFNHPKWLIKRFKKDWPDDWQAILKANDTHPPMTLRVNQLNHTTEQYLHLLKEQQIDASKTKHSPQGIVLNTPCDVYELPGFSKGDVSVQDEAAQLATGLMDLKPSFRVLDACSAPGGKTCHILETEPALGTCLALDIDKHRLARVQENLSRINLKAELKVGNASSPSTWWDGKPFDRILLDAPCSATGVIRRHPDIKLLRTKDEVQEVVKTQSELLAALWPLLAKNGKLLYATCSVMPEENEQQIAQFIASTPNASVSQISMPWGRSTGHGWQILPGDFNMDGFFYSLITKISAQD